MSTDFNILTEYFQDGTETLCEIDEDRKSVQTWVKTPAGALQVSLRLFDESGSTVLFLTRNIITIPEEHRERAHYLINLINHDMIIGNFEMNPASGEVSYRNAFCICDTGMTARQVRHSLRSSVGLSNKYKLAFNRLVWGEKGPVESLVSIFNDSNDETTNNDPEIPQNYATEVIKQVEEMMNLPVETGTSEEQKSGEIDRKDESSE